MEVVRDQAAHREPAERGAAGEQHDQQQGKQERGQGIADHDQCTAPGIEAAAVAHCLADAQRDGHQVGDQRGPEAQRQGDRQLVEDQVGDLGAAEEAVAEVQPGVLAQHQPQALGGGLVEAVLALDLLDQFRVQATGGT